jgi:hypothetical protein
MKEIRCSLLADGSSDTALLPILQWTMKEHIRNAAMQCVWADLRRIPRPPRELWDKICTAVELYPCHILFIHRDAEGQVSERRYEEIMGAMVIAQRKGLAIPHICIVPIRMQEAWLLLDEAAIRKASGNPNGRMPLVLPSVRSIESIRDPKGLLYQHLRDVSGLHGRRLKKFRPECRASRITDYMHDFNCLRALSAYRRLENDVQQIIRRLPH